VSISPAFAGLAPGLVGLYQVNLPIPPNQPEGNHALRIVARGAASNAVTVPVRLSPPPAPEPL